MDLGSLLIIIVFVSVAGVLIALLKGLLGLPVLVASLVGLPLAFSLIMLCVWIIGKVSKRK